MESKGQSLFWNFADLILKVQVIDQSGKKFFKESCNITNKKRLNEIFELLKSKYNLDIPKSLKEDMGWSLG